MDSITKKCIKRIWCYWNKSFLIIFVIPLLFFNGSLFAQDYTGTFTGPGQWSDDTKWSPVPSASFLAGNITGNCNITINGKVIVGTESSWMNLTVSSGGTLNPTVSTGDTLFIWGNLNISGNASNFNMNGCCIIVRGDVNVNTGGTLNIGGASGSFFGVSGSYNNNGGSVFNSNGTAAYILGDADSPFVCSAPDTYSGTSDGSCKYGNRVALINNTDAYTRWLLLSPLAIDAACSITHAISCNGDSDGEVTVTASGGSFAYQYSSDGVTWYPSSSYTAETTHTFTGLSDGSYTFYIRDDQTIPAEDNCTINVDQPGVLSFSLSGQNWSCNSPCNGRITVNITGGTSPYTVTVDGTPILGTTASSLCSGNHTVSIADANGCPVTTVQPADYSIALDNVAPTCTTPPTDFFMTLSAYNSLASVSGAITPEAGSPEIRNSFPAPTNCDTLIYEFNTTDRDKLLLSFNVGQTGTGWSDVADSVAFYLDYDGNGVLDQRVYADYGAWNAPATYPVPLMNVAAGQNPIRIYVFYYAEAGKSYSTLSVSLSGNSMAASVPTVNGLSGCTDNYSTATVSHIDGAINWECNVSGNQEFWFNRTYTVTDACGNTSSPYVQRIGVGEYPVLTDPRDTIFDFCHNTNVQIAIPAHSDFCDPDVVMHFDVVAQGKSTIVASGDPALLDTDVTITFPLPVLNDTVYVITWIATDAAGLFTTQTQNVTIKRPITADITPATFDFCSEATGVSFTLAPSGGTGSYIPLKPGPSLDDVGYTVTITPNGSMSGNTYTTSNLTTAAPNIQVIYIDVTVSGAGGVEGGCHSATITFYGTGADYFVHEKITTGAITRD